MNKAKHTAPNAYSSQSYEQIQQLQKKKSSNIKQMCPEIFFLKNMII